MSREEGLLRAARAASHALKSVVACREGITDELLLTVIEALDEAIQRATQEME